MAIESAAAMQPMRPAVVRFRLNSAAFEFELAFLPGVARMLQSTMVCAATCPSDFFAACFSPDASSFRPSNGTNGNGSQLFFPVRAE